MVTSWYPPAGAVSWCTGLRCLVGVSAGCPPDWINYRNACYFLSKDMQSFDDAEAICVKKSGSLLVLEDVEEQVNKDT